MAKRKVTKDSILKDIRTVLNRSRIDEAYYEEAVDLWSILTALRGPDSFNDEIKAATTAVIRNAIGVPEGVLAMVSPDSAEKHAVRARLYAGHFMRHARAAFRALGLDWDKVNR